MEWRKWAALGVCGGALALAGCNREQPTLPVQPANNGQLMIAPPTPPAEGVKAKKEADGPPVQPKAHMDVAMADMAAAESSSPKWTPVQAQEVRNNARVLYQRAIATDPKHLPAYQGLAKLYLAMDDLDHAVATYEKALKVEPTNAKVYYELGMVHARARQWEAAVKHLGRAADLDPENRRHAHMLGFALTRDGRTDEALAVFGKVDGPALAHFNLARMLEQMGQVEPAKDHLQKSLGQNPRADDARHIHEMLARLEKPAAPAVGGVRTVGHDEPGDEADGLPMPAEVPAPAHAAQGSPSTAPPPAPREED